MSQLMTNIIRILKNYRDVQSKNLGSVTGIFASSCKDCYMYEYNIVLQKNAWCYKYNIVLQYCGYLSLNLVVRFAKPRRHAYR